MPNSRKNQREKAAAHEPPPTLGAILRSAREARGIPIEMAAHHTRIRASRLREMEADDLSHLPPAYARYFVNHYAGYLKVPQAAIRGFLPEADAFGVDGYQYIANAASDSPEPHRPRPRRARKGPLRAALALAAMLLAIGAAVQGALILKKLERVRALEDRAALEAGPETRYPEEFIAVGDPSHHPLAGGSPSSNSSTP